MGHRKKNQDIFLNDHRKRSRLEYFCQSSDGKNCKIVNSSQKTSTIARKYLDFTKGPSHKLMFFITWLSFL